jgi:hypothetical protein
MALVILNLMEPYAFNRNVVKEYSSVPSLQMVGKEVLTANGYYGSKFAGQVSKAFEIIDTSTPSPPYTTLSDLLKFGTWQVTDYNASMMARHEVWFVMVARVAVLLSGYGGWTPNI